MTRKGVWNIQQVRDKQLQSLWDYDTTEYALYVWGGNSRGQLGLNQPQYTKYDSPVQVPGTWTTGILHGNSTGYQKALS